MKDKSHLYVINWKMYLTFNEALEFCIKNFQELSKLDLILCPSFESIRDIKKILEKTNIKIGAQDCSGYLSGPYTSQISAKSLKEIGVSYCLIGHSEIRKQCKENIKLKIERALENNITPIVCIGEESSNVENKSFLEKQLKPIVKYNEIYIAYEPVWAIGSGKIPDLAFLKRTFEFLSNLAEKQKLLYGGSVNVKNIHPLKKISPLINGFLIGKASLDFQNLKKIVLS